MNEEGSHASFATLETRPVSAGKVGVNGATNKPGERFSLLQSSNYFERSSLPKKKKKKKQTSSSLV